MKEKRNGSEINLLIQEKLGEFVSFAGVRPPREVSIEDNYLSFLGLYHHYITVSRVQDQICIGVHSPSNLNEAVTE